MSKRFKARDDASELSVGIPDRLPKTRKRACSVCTTVGPKATVQFCMRRTGKPQGTPIGDSMEVCRIMQPLAEADRESFWALHLDIRHRIVDIDRVSVGNMTSVEVRPAEVFRGALLTGAQDLIFVHNHPSGDPAPSPQDRLLTARLKNAGDLLGIGVIDHVVIGSEGCVSMADRGLLGEGRSREYSSPANQRSSRRKR